MKFYYSDSTVYFDTGDSIVSDSWMVCILKGYRLTVEL